VKNAAVGHVSMNHWYNEILYYQTVVMVLDLEYLLSMAFVIVIGHKHFTFHLSYHPD